jgi:putative hydrolase of the HAD superfamily
MKTYHHIFFDLDHTLWDFEKNSNETLQELHQKHLDEAIIPLNKFLEVFHRINAHLWHLHDTLQITAKELRESRFQLIFAEFDFHHSQLAQLFAEAYLAQTPQKPHLLPKAKETIAYLHAKYPLHIITNGFPEIQRIKMQSGGILHFFQEIVTSQEAGCKKPDTGIFKYLIEKLGASPQNCIMIGDNPFTDIAGAREAGIDTIFYNPKQQPITTNANYEIKCLGELINIL